MINFCVVSAGHDMYTDTSKAAKFKPTFQAHWYPHTLEELCSESLAILFVEKNF